MKPIQCECGEPIYRDTDDMITMGGVFEVWYAMTPSGKRSMCCEKRGTMHLPKKEKP